jgi:hypothetical protein
MVQGLFGRKSPSLTALETALVASWSESTSVEPAAWSDANPALGQCAVTAIVLQDYCGGEILRSRIDGKSHYYNLVDGRELDLTRRQFRTGAIETERGRASREYVLSYPETMRRYEILRQRVAEHLPR